MSILAQPPLITPPAYPAESGSDINWGGVAKGALIVTGIVVAAVVGFAVFSAVAGMATTAIAGNATASAIAGSTAHLATSGAGLLGHGVNILTGVVTNIPSFFVNLFGIQGTAFAAGHGAAAAAMTHTVGLAGAAAAGAVATHALVPGLHDIHLTNSHMATHGTDIPAPDDSSLASGIFAAGTGAHAASAVHEAAHAAHSAHELNEEESSAWREKFANRNASASFADNIGTRNERKPVTPRSDNFAEQLNADRANLDLVLDR